MASTNSRKTFRPTIESLEARQLLAANLAHALPVTRPDSVNIRPFLNTTNVEQSTRLVGGPQATQGQVADLSGLSVTDALRKGSNWIIYEPKTSAGGQYVSPAQIRQELQMLYDRGFRGVVTYSFNNGREEIPAIAKQIGFQQVIAGVWAVKDYAVEKANLTPERLKNIDGLCVGNETQLRKDYGIDVLKARVAEVKALSGKPTTTADAWHLYQGGKHVGTELMKVGDWVFPNMHPWYEKSWAAAHQNPASGVTLVQNILDDHFDSATTGGRIVALHESWWPTASEGAYDTWANSASEANQKGYYEALSKTKVNFIYGEAFDQAWKSNEGDTPAMGKFGGYWGLYRGLNDPKAAVSTLYMGERPGYAGPRSQADTSALDAYYSGLASR